MKFSARIIMKRMNFLQRIFSISSACFTAMLIRIELIEVSINTFSLSFLDITTGVNKSSLLVLTCAANEKKIILFIPSFLKGAFYILTSTSGLLCLSTTWEEKFSKHMAAAKVCLTAFKYGLSVADIFVIIYEKF